MDGWFGMAGGTERRRGRECLPGVALLAAQGQMGSIQDKKAAVIKIVHLPPPLVTIQAGRAKRGSMLSHESGSRLDMASLAIYGGRDKTPFLVAGCTAHGQAGKIKLVVHQAKTGQAIMIKLL